MSDQTAPSQLQGNIDWALGSAQKTFGQVIGSEDMQRAGDRAVKTGDQQVNTAKEEAYAKAQGDNVAGKIKSGLGMVSGNQTMQQQGNQQAQLGEIKKAVNDPDGVAGHIPQDRETLQQRAEGKLQAVEGMITGDQNKQTRGNLKDAGGEAQDFASKAADSLSAVTGYKDNHDGSQSDQES